MPVALDYPKNISPVAGVRLSSIPAGIRTTQGDDVVLVELAEGSRVAASLTQNLFCAAPVIVTKEHLTSVSPRYLLINAGNANAGNGDLGLRDARACCRALAELVNIPEQAVLPFSTGVIGKALPVEKITAVLPKLLRRLGEDRWLEAARAIMTTDTVPKAVTRIIETDGGSVCITGIAKGAGMICPNMATMLGFIATDAAVDQIELERLHRQGVDQSFNRITVDGDTSTNDACLLLTTGKGARLSPVASQWLEFKQALHDVYQWLAQAIIRDAEGASKFVTIIVTGGQSQLECNTVARTIAHSPLVKTALYASDANWGRILAAVGRAGVTLTIDKVSIAINGCGIVARGQPHPDYSEKAGLEAMSKAEIEINVDLGSGSAEYTLWTSDLSHDYVSINADYRT